MEDQLKIAIMDGLVSQENIGVQADGYWYHGRIIKMVSNGILLRNRVDGLPLFFNYLNIQKVRS